MQPKFTAHHPSLVKRVDLGSISLCSDFSPINFFLARTADTRTLRFSPCFGALAFSAAKVTPIFFFFPSTLHHFQQGMASASEVTLPGTKSSCSGGTCPTRPSCHYACCLISSTLLARFMPTDVIIIRAGDTSHTGILDEIPLFWEGLVLGCWMPHYSLSGLEMGSFA